MNFKTSNLVLETFVRMLSQKLLKDRSVLAPHNPLFLQWQRLGENYGSFNDNWFKVSMKLQLADVKSAPGHCRKR